MTQYRVETDSMGDIDVPKDALYGAQTQRAVNNFPISGLQMPSRFLDAVVRIKRSAAIVNHKLGLLEIEIAHEIVTTCDLILSGNYSEHFPVDIFQTGSGTSTNMNVNEVIAHLANQKLNQRVDPNDHVNMGQSSNDVIPTAIHLSAALALQNELLPALEYLNQSLKSKAITLSHYVKTGRTHLMDAMPIRLDQELSAWAGQISQNTKQLESLLPALKSLAQGGTAVGTGVNAHPDFPALFVKELGDLCELEFTVSDNFFVSISSQDTAVTLSGQLKTLAVSLTKISNDLRWMNSGPLSGLGEIKLEALQPGSSIMPGKVNPTQCEALTMVCAQVIGNDMAIAVGGMQGHYELNVFKPVMAANFLQSAQLIGDACVSFNEHCAAGIEANTEVIKTQLNNSLMLVTALNTKIGYYKAAEIANTAHKNGTTLKVEAVRLGYLTEDEFDAWVKPENMVGH